MTVAPDTGPVIRVRGLTKRYGDVQAVDGIDFDVAKGEIFGLLGPNGAGKTTTVEILEGLRDADGGEVSVLGVDVRDADAIKPRIGVSLQTAALYPKLTVTELVDLFRSFYPRVCRPRRSSMPWRSASGAMREARSCRVGSVSGWRWPSPWSMIRSSCSWTNPRPASTRRPVDRSGTSSRA